MEVLKTVTLNLQTPVCSYKSKACLDPIVKVLAQRINDSLYLAASRQSEGQVQCSEMRIVSQDRLLSSSIVC